MPRSKLHITIAQVTRLRDFTPNPHEAAAATRVLRRLKRRLRGYGKRTCARCGLTWRPKSRNPRFCGCCGNVRWRVPRRESVRGRKIETSEPRAALGRASP